MASSRTCRALTEFFASLNLPAPGATALFVALVEFVGGILFALGLGSRLVSLVLFVNMTVAYLSVPDDRVNFSHILSNPSDFYNATPYTYWFAALHHSHLRTGPHRASTHSIRRAFENGFSNRMPPQRLVGKEKGRSIGPRPSPSSLQISE